MEISLSIIPHKLTWITAKYPPTGRVLNSDQDFPYIPLHSENGPLDLQTTIRFCKTLEKMISEGPTVHYCSVKSIEKSNGAYLMGAFLVLVLKQTPQQAWENFQNLPLLFLHYRDAAPGYSNYKCSILHCLQVLHKALKFNWIDYLNFDTSEYSSKYFIEKGDITWIVYQKIAVFSCPSSEPRDQEGTMNFTPENYSATFHKLGIKNVIRLDGYSYEPERFVRNGINFFDLGFKGPLPSLNIISKFLELLETLDSGSAVHCKAGLGKSPTLVAMYIMKHFDVTAEECIAWCRICRPGSIVGQQQEFVKQLERKCKAMKKRDVGFSTRESSFFSSRKNTRPASSATDIRNSMKMPKGLNSKTTSLGRLLFSDKGSFSGTWSSRGHY